MEDVQMLRDFVYCVIDFVLVLAVLGLVFEVTYRRGIRRGAWLRRRLGIR